MANGTTLFSHKCDSYFCVIPKQTDHGLAIWNALRGQESAFSLSDSDQSQVSTRKNRLLSTGFTGLHARKPAPRSDRHLTDKLFAGSP